MTSVSILLIIHLTFTVNVVRIHAYGTDIKEEGQPKYPNTRFLIDEFLFFIRIMICIMM